MQGSDSLDCSEATEKSVWPLAVLASRRRHRPAASALEPLGGENLPHHCAKITTQTHEALAASLVL